jgi:hypothetical protein
MKLKELAQVLTSIFEPNEPHTASMEKFLEERMKQLSNHIRSFHAQEYVLDTGEREAKRWRHVS